jgi:hypothetical protein
MRTDQGFDILHNGMTRTFRDQKAMAYEAARFAKTQNPADIIELVDRSSGTKLVMLADGRDVIVARRVLQIALSLVPAL